MLNIIAIFSPKTNIDFDEIKSALRVWWYSYGQ